MLITLICAGKQNFSWELDHEPNLERISEVKRHEINEDGLQFRYRLVVKKLWDVWNMLQDIMKSKVATVETLALIQRKYSAAYNRLQETAQSALEDGLFIYRQSLADHMIAYIGHVKHYHEGKHKLDDHFGEVFDMIACETPYEQRISRFSAMGYSKSLNTWVQARATKFSEGVCRPLAKIIATANGAPSAPSPGGLMSPIFTRRRFTWGFSLPA